MQRPGLLDKCLLSWLGRRGQDGGEGPGLGSVPLLTGLPHTTAARYTRSLEVITSGEVSPGHLTAGTVVSKSGPLRKRDPS